MSNATTRLSEQQLVMIRARGAAQRTRFTDPLVITRLHDVLDRRGEAWAAKILGRDIQQRSLAVPRRPYLRNGEDYALLAADTCEDEAVLAESAAAEKAAEIEAAKQARQDSRRAKKS